MISIRKYQQKDKDNLRKICLETSSYPIDTEEQRKFLFLLYNDYYSEVEPENCFVAADENDEAVGYIICAENFKEYSRVFTKFYLPEIKELGTSYYLTALAEMTGHRAFSKKYPAHLHIDILPGCQGQGVGTELIIALKRHLKSKGINSIMLSCGANNTGAIKFYKKNNFNIIMKIAGSCIMASNF